MGEIVTASKLVELLNEHIEKYGDEEIRIFDDYKGAYRRIRTYEISRLGNKFVIECEQPID